MNGKKSSIKNHMLKIIILGVVFPIVILITISAIKFKNFAEEIAKKNAIEHANTFADNIYKQFCKVFAAVDYYAEIQSALFDENGISKLTFTELQKIDKKILTHNEHILDIYTIIDSGKIILEESGSPNENMVLLGTVISNNSFSELKNYNYKYKSNIKDSLRQGNGYIFLPPYYDKINGDSILIVSYSHELKHNNEIIGNVGVDITINWIQDYIQSKSLFNNKAEITIITGKGIIVGNNKNKSLTGKNIKDIYTNNKTDFKFLNSKEKHIIKENGIYKFYIPVIFTTLKHPIYIKITVPQKAVLEDSIIDLIKRIVFAIAILSIALFITYYYSQKLIVRILKLVKITGKLSKGHLAVEFDDDGDDEIRELNDSLKNMTNRFSNILGGIKETTGKLYSSSTDLSNVAIKLSEGASEQASSTQEVSASMEQMTAIIEQNSENAKFADSIARKSAEGIAASSKNVVQTTKSMGEIANKTSIIGDIAFQTNILALNAAVEAARAGIHGKGFGVVAAEVGKLAENSKKAANEIDELTNKSFAIAKRSGELLQQIEPDIKKTAQLVQEIANASIEQKAGTEQINNAIQQLNNVTQENAGSAELLATNVEVLNSLADKLEKLSGFFKLEKRERKIKNTKQKKTETKKENLSKKLKEKEIKPANEKNNDFASSKDFKLNPDNKSDDKFEKF